VKIRASLVALALVALALPAAAAGPNDKVTGAGLTVPTSFGSSLQFSLEAKSDADGSDARGNLNYRDVNWTPNSPNGRARVTEMCVVGDQAALFGDFVGDPAQFPFGPGFPNAFVLVQDNGNPNNGTPDLAFVTGWAGGHPNICTLFGLYASALRPLESGNLSVTDAS
jgi:hypothetical protein